MEHIDTFDKLTVEYNSGPIPPPFCHRYKIDIAKTDTRDYRIHLNLEYYDRDEVTIEEILDEGFSIDDDFTWQGKLPDIWGLEIISKLKSTNWKKKLSAEADGKALLIKIQHQTRTEVLQPADIRTWEVFCQGIIQAVFELGNKEAPLIISFVNKSSKEQTKQVDFEFSFAYRSIKITKQKHKHTSMEWEDGQHLLKYIYGLDYLPEYGHEKLPKKPGNYIFPGDGLCYELTPKTNSDSVINEKINKLVMTLSSYIKN